MSHSVNSALTPILRYLDKVSVSFFFFLKFLVLPCLSLSFIFPFSLSDLILFTQAVSHAHGRLQQASWYAMVGEERRGGGSEQDTEQTRMGSVLAAVVPRWKTLPGVVATADTAFFPASTEALNGGFLVTQA